MNENVPMEKHAPEHWLDEPQNVNCLWRGFLVVLALTVLAELLVTLHPHFAVEGLFGFHAWFGLLTCLLMIVGAKFLALFLKRPDDYYATGPVADTESRHDD